MFLWGKTNLRCSLIANEVIDSRLKASLRGLLCKLDIEKAYDHVNWNHLIAMMDKMGFGSKWLGWIRWCISMIRFSILVNSSPFGFFSSSRGLKQEDPLSPYFFILVMEILYCLISRAMDGGLLRVSELKRGMLRSSGLPLSAPYKSSRERNPLWKWVIVGKYGTQEEERCTKKKDRWCGDMSLRDEFPGLYVIASFKDVWVVDVWDGGSWGPRFIEQFNDWELEEVNALFRRLHSYSFGSGTFDTMVWLKIKDGDFQFSSFTPLWQVKEWSLSHTAQCGILGPLLELAFLLGRQHGLRLTQDQLRQRGWKMPNRCYMCKAKEETGDHLLLHCPKASTLWQLVCALFHIQWVMHSLVRGVLLSWNGVPIGKKRKKLGKLLLFAFFGPFGENEIGELLRIKNA
ncbi:hypothetical protein CK203_050341 [Vitis vinifera]|uniref:Reverse transcriptase domain-containing protein n=1 Tax=Vitis vinifera TaxID=29760 RepID=A0A438GZS9_VITVI|nr:hypothetical protein CK203_050341 [Vitis vinifera]